MELKLSTEFAEIFVKTEDIINSFFYGPIITVYIYEVKSNNLKPAVIEKLKSIT